MILENAYEFKEYLALFFDEMGFRGNFEIIDNAIHLNIISETKTPTKEQILEKVKEIMLKKKKQELKDKINATCKEKIINHFRSDVLGSMHAYDLALEDQSNLQALVYAGIDSFFKCAEVSNGVLGNKTYKKHTKAQLLELSKQALRFKYDLIVFYGREKERLNAINSLKELEKFAIKEYLT
ncbi:hypothetical protein [Helicobacter pylori]|uniref:hypothetical protein n=1 Tax=Helicobacter pylori TaxID=210 RepID=UPI00165C9E36|nr:hypothetical protein [Helicobacter pylori]